MRRRSSGSSRILPRCQVSNADPRRSIHALDDRERGVDVVHLDVVQHELVDDLASVYWAASGAELRVPLHDLRELALRAHDVADLDVVDRQLGGRLEQKRASRIERHTRRRSSGSRTESPRTSSSSLIEPVLVDDLPQLGGVPRLQHVFEVCMPDPDAPEIRPGRPARSAREGRTGSTPARSAPRPVQNMVQSRAVGSSPAPMARRPNAHTRASPTLLVAEWPRRYSSGS